MARTSPLNDPLSPTPCWYPQKKSLKIMAYSTLLIIQEDLTSTLEKIPSSWENSSNTVQNEFGTYIFFNDQTHSHQRPQKKTRNCGVFCILDSLKSFFKHSNFYYHPGNAPKISACHWEGQCKNSNISIQYPMQMCIQVIRGEYGKHVSWRQSAVDTRRYTGRESGESITAAQRKRRRTRKAKHELLTGKNRRS